MLYELVDAGDQIPDTAEAAATDGPLGDESEPSFDLIEPGRIGGRVMNVETWPGGEPDTHLGVFVGSVVVHDQVHVQTVWNCRIDLLEKTEKLLMAVARLAVGEDGAGGDVESSKIFADGADKAGMLEMYRNSAIQGFTTNPTLMRKAGVRDYGTFARDILAAIPDRPISLEVLSDDFQEVERQARIISSWADNVYVKIPITNTKGELSTGVVRRLNSDGIKINVTALLTLDQVRSITASLTAGTSAYVSIFAGRIADTGCDPIPIMTSAVEMLKDVPNTELIWASPRELLNVFQADSIGCHIITATNDILKKLELVGKDLSDYSLDTVKMFYSDATASGFTVQ